MRNLLSGDLEKYKGYFKTIICSALLEHVKDPFSVAENVSDFLTPVSPLSRRLLENQFFRFKDTFSKIQWEEWWYTGTTDKVGFTIGEVRNERKVFQLESEITSEINNISDRYMPYLNICAVRVKNI